MKTASALKLFLTGLRISIPIALGYFTVSIALGIFWVRNGFSPLLSGVASFTTMSSTGQFAGVTLFAQHSGALEIIATTLLVNSRYLLMSMSMSMKLPPGTGLFKRLFVAAGVSDELFALHSSKPQLVLPFFFGTMVLPIVGWTTGTWVGAYAGEVIPPDLQVVANILLFAMFVAIILPPAKDYAPILFTILLASGLSVLLWWAPWTAHLEFGWRLIGSAVLSAALLAWFFPEGASGKHSGEELKPSRWLAHGKAKLAGIRRVQLIPRIFPWYAPEKYGDVPLAGLADETVSEGGK
ncbi:AzlC protein [Gleimia coleocanis DSM 15436]|uniref:AzlC protein n=1 Tax=Gleimia coleocanis DSM 15436 TaxID=525245 RepID=C0VY39_9ACTO|nr:AzlC family ABC transporter permease [Gleimia coleocanis]EEH64342.1 AzlC protein [Gleimia coleocanis DSM 15436]